MSRRMAAVQGLAKYYGRRGEPTAEVNTFDELREKLRKQKEGQRFLKLRIFMSYISSTGHASDRFAFREIPGHISYNRNLMIVDQDCGIRIDAEEDMVVSSIEVAYRDGWRQIQVSQADANRIIPAGSNLTINFTKSSNPI